MIKLLEATFTRLRKSKIFWILIFFSVIIALFMIYTRYSDMKTYGDVIEVEQIMLNYATILGIIISIFASIFLGVEYSDGAIRNKISIGHKRRNIYLSNFIVITVTSLCFYILFLIIVTVIGIPLFGNITIPIESLLKLIACIFMVIISYSSIFTFISMLISNKTITAVISIMLAFALMMVALTALRILDTQEYIQTGSMVNGEMKFEEVLNPKYPSEEKKIVCQVLLDINPAGQSFQIAGRMAPNLNILPLYSLVIALLFTTTGMIIFNKKELK